MPQVIVTTDHCDGDMDGAANWREWVSLTDFDSEHFVAQFVERLMWAVGDAQDSGRPASGEQAHAVSPVPAERRATNR